MILDRFAFERQKTINAICGSDKQPSSTRCDEYAKHGWMKFTGNQHNEQWEWNRDALKTLSTDLLNHLYEKLQNSSL